jgi:RecB family exonuclease
MRLSASKIACYQDCPRKYYLRYIEGWQMEARIANLAFGTAVHAAFQAVCESQVGAYAGICTPLEVFEQTWDDETCEGTDKEPEELEKLHQKGRRMITEMEKEWPDYGYTPLIHDGRVMVEWKFEVELGTRDVASGRIDLLALSPESDITLLDAKTAASATKVLTPMDQDVLYTFAVEQKLDLSVGKAGYFELLKRGVKAKPETNWTNLAFDARVSDEVLEEFKDKWIGYAADIRGGRFPREPRQRHNSPCKMCEFFDLCWHGDATGLVKTK